MTGADPNVNCWLKIDGELNVAPLINAFVRSRGFKGDICQRSPVRTHPGNGVFNLCSSAVDGIQEHCLFAKSSKWVHVTGGLKDMGMVVSGVARL